MFESHRRYEAYYLKLDYFCKRLYYSKPEKAFITNDFMELIQLYNSYATFEEISKDLYDLIGSFTYLDENGTLKK